MFDKIKQKLKKIDEKSWEKSIKEWRKHPKSNNLIVFFICGIYLAFAIFIIIYFLTGQTKNYLVLIGPILCFIFIIYILHIRKTIIKKAFPKKFLKVTNGS